jgi:hypothetical protein
MSVTLEEAQILVSEMQMESSSFQQALDAMRRWAYIRVNGHHLECS